MHKNYYLFKSQTNWLNGQIKDFTIQECFTFQKSELVLKIGNKEEFFLQISINQSNPYMLLSESRNIKESKVNLFDELANQKIIGLNIDDSDKIISITTESYLLSSVFYGRSPNIFLYDLNKNNIAQFKKDNANKLKIDASEKLFVDTLEPYQLKESIQSNSNLNITKFLSRNIVGLNYTIARECCFRCNIDFDTEITSLSEIQIENLCKNIKNIILEFDNPNPSIYYDNEIPKHLVISKILHLEKDFQHKSFQSLNDAWNKYIWQSKKSQAFDKLVKQSFSALNNRIEYLNKTISKIEEFEKLEERKQLAELKGNLLLTFINKVPRGAKSIELENLFSEKKEKVQIKLNPAKSVQDNAQKYFEKFKDIDTQKERITNRKSVLKNELNSFLEIHDKYSNINSQKEALKLRELLVSKNLIHSSKEDSAKNEIPQHKFKKIVLAEKWNVFIGKNNVNNDLLTFSFAHKYDWWFHAQSVPGSHTIIHLNNREEVPPKDIIEEVASLAAFHSSAKHSGGVPVIYTQVRYVRRIKKANPGTVSVLQHKTIFIEPKNM